MSERIETTTFAELMQQGVLEIGDGYRAKLEELGGNGPIFLRAGLLTDRGFDWSAAEHFHADRATKLSSKFGHPGDTMVTTKGNSVGRTGFVPDNSPEFVYSPHLSYWRSLDRVRLALGFLRYWSRSPEFLAQLRSMANSTDMAPYLSLSDQRRLQVSLPGIDMQEAVAEVLGALDDKIAANDRIAETGEDLALAIASDERWPKRVSLGSIVSCVRSQVSPESMSADVVAHYSLPAFDEDKLPELVHPGTIKSGKFLVDGPTVLLSKLNPATPRVWSVRPNSSIPALASTEFLVLKPAEGVAPDEVWAVSKQPTFTGDLVGMATGTSNSHQRVRPNDLLATEVVDPRSMPENDRETVIAVAERSRQARLESKTLACLRDTLLPKLMSGEIRVRDAEKVVEDVT